MRKVTARPGCTLDRHGQEVGRDPRDMTLADFKSLGHPGDSPLAALRRRCLDCCGYQAAEVAKCVSTTCPSWPYRMATNPFRKPRTEAQVAASTRQGARLQHRARQGHENDGVRGDGDGGEGEVQAATTRGHAAHENQDPAADRPTDRPMPSD